MTQSWFIFQALQYGKIIASLYPMFAPKSHCFTMTIEMFCTTPKALPLRSSQDNSGSQNESLGTAALAYNLFELCSLLSTEFKL